MQDPRARLEDILRERIGVLDGSWGVLIQRQVKGEEAYRGERFKDHPRDVAGDPDETKIGLIDRNIGQDSEFHRMNGMYAEGVTLSTAVLPEGWRKRLVRFQPPTLYPVQALCLEPHDCVASKMVAGRSKDYDFANAMLARGLVSPGTLGKRIDLLPITGREKDLLHRWLQGQIGRLKRSIKKNKSPGRRQPGA